MKALFQISTYALTGLVVLGLSQARFSRRKRVASQAAGMDEQTALFI